jgi:hypothetical protein
MSTMGQQRLNGLDVLNFKTKKKKNIYIYIYIEVISEDVLDTSTFASEHPRKLRFKFI